MLATRRAFTLIELLVVIAIIGVLSAVILASLGTARQNGQNAGVKKNLADARSQAELFYDINGDRYSVNSTGAPTTDLCSPSGSVNGVKGVYDQFKAAADAAGVTANTSLTTVTSATVATCHSCPTSGWTCNPKNAWAAAVPLKGGSYFCVDSSGYAAVTTLTLASGDASCL
jgi:prepilin-type N-terminal cleavage/methylation domain-containing protein